jgi:DNA-binding ferritin-like protein
MARFRKRLSRQESDENLPAAEDDIAERLASYGAEPEARMAEPEPTEPEAQLTESEQEAPAPADTANIAAHVQNVLKAAEDAAARVLEEARAKAAEIRGGAERERAARIEAAEAEAARLREEAEREHGAALAAATAARAEADEEAETIRAEAERAASSFETTTASRYEQLLKDTAFAEERLRRLVRGLREAADHLDSLLGPRGAQAEEEPDADAEEPSLVDALEPHGSTADVGRR